MGDGLRQLKEMLRGFEVTIVYVYRELLSHMVSVYFELNRFEHDIRATEPFSTYLLKNLDYINPVLEPMPLLRDYSAVFGHDNIAVIDLYGCPTDVTYVLICELAGAMCHRPDLFVYNKHINANAKYSLVHSEVFSAFNAYVESQRGGQCKFCRPLRDAFKVFDATLRARLAQRGAPTLPLIRSGLGMLVPNAEKIDATLRTQYGDRILHGNPAASLKAMKRRVHVESLDLATFLSSKEWAAWMRHSFAMAMSQGQICGCK